MTKSGMTTLLSSGKVVKWSGGLILRQPSGQVVILPFEYIRQFNLSYLGEQRNGDLWGLGLNRARPHGVLD